MLKKKLRMQILKLYPRYHTVYGPYLRKNDNRKIIILYDGNKRSARLLAKVKLEVKLGRRLTKNETVDHKDEISTNDKFSNLQVLSRRKNIQKGYRKGSLLPPTPKIGVDNLNSILTEKEVLKIRLLYKMKKSSQRKLALTFKVSRSTIISILERRTWKHI